MPRGIRNRNGFSIDELFDDLSEYTEAIMYDAPNDYHTIRENGGEVPKHLHEFRYSLITLLMALDQFYNTADTIVERVTKD
jgi:hypothetical protein